MTEYTREQKIEEITKRNKRHKALLLNGEDILAIFEMKEIYDKVPNDIDFLLSELQTLQAERDAFKSSNQINVAELEQVKAERDKLIEFAKEVANAKLHGIGSDTIHAAYFKRIANERLKELGVTL